MNPDEGGNQEMRPGPNAYDLRMIALEHAVQTRCAEDDSEGKKVIDRAEKFLHFLKGTNPSAEEGN